MKRDYSGHKDSNGVKIYSGDTIEAQALFGGGYIRTDTAKVKSKEEGFYPFNRDKNDIELIESTIKVVDKPI